MASPFLTSALRHGRFFPWRKPSVLTEQEAGFAPGQVRIQGKIESSLAPVGNRTPDIQLVDRHYTERAIPVPSVTDHALKCRH
jgi:hypothetical protein